MSVENKLNILKAKIEELVQVQNKVVEVVNALVPAYAELVQEVEPKTGEAVTNPYANRLPTRTYPNDIERANLPAKFDNYSNPEKYGITLNREGRMFNAAVAEGFVDNTPAGLGTFLYWLGLGRMEGELAEGLKQGDPVLTRFSEFKRLFI